MLERVISGGQTGVDQAGLRAAKACGIPTGGWVPKGWRTDEGAAPWLAEYGCVEHASAAYPPRTTANINMADLTVWFGDVTSPGGRLTKGTALYYVEHYGKRYVENPTPVQLRATLTRHGIRVLNVAGNRERSFPGIGARVEALLREVFHVTS